MKFTLNTKPLVNALNLAIIPANISQYYARSTIVQLTATKDELIINTESSATYSEAHVKGSGDSDIRATTFVSSIALKQLVSSFDVNIISIEFVERPGSNVDSMYYDGIILHAGKSKFTLPNTTSDEADNSLKTPNQKYKDTVPMDLHQDNWKFVQAHQMFALGMSFTNPAYTMVWIGQDGDTIVGDYDRSIFTHSVSNPFATTCLLSDTIINLFTAVPEESKVYCLGDTYVIESITDSYKFVSEFVPNSEEVTGSYNADIILSTMPKTKDESFTLDISELNKFLSQASIISTSASDTVDWKFYDSALDVIGDYVDYHASVQAEPSAPNYQLKFNFDQLRSALSKLDENLVSICPLFRGDECIGVNVWTDKLTIVLAGAE